MPPLPRRIASVAVVLFMTGMSSLFAQEHLATGSPVETNQAAQIPSSLISTKAADIEQGANLYQTHCASCHGPGGEGGKGPTLAQPTLPRASDDASLLRIIREGIGGTEMPRSRMERHEIAAVAAFVKSLGSKAMEQVSGDAKRGAEIYATKGACAQCHTIRGAGGAFGPDLTDIGRRRSAAYLRRSLVDPGAEVPQSFSAFRSDISLPQNFLQVRVVTRNEQEITGVRVNEDTFSIQIRDATGRIHSFFKDEVAELHKEFGKSPMPSYAEALTRDELEDVVAYLVALRGEN